jgi:DNA-binding ferritin-like protein (Dps family)
MNEVDKMIRENREISKKLNEENHKIYVNIVCYIRVSSINEKEKEQIIADILDMFLRGQEEGKAIQEIIGNDYKAFCDSIIQSVRPKKIKEWDYFNKAWEYIKYIINGICILLTIDFVFRYIPMVIKYRAIVSYPVNISIFITTIIILLIAMAVVKYIMKNSFKLSHKKFSKKDNFLFGAGYALLVLLMAMMSLKLSNCVLFSVSAYYVIFIVGIYWLYKLVIKVYERR